jgi:hypothetical protein
MPPVRRVMSDYRRLRKLVDEFAVWLIEQGRCEEAIELERRVWKKFPTTEVEDEEFLAVYAIFPRKVGKTDGIKILKATVTTRADFDLCIVAVKKYAAAVRGQDAKYVRHFDRWARTWRDWVEYEEKGPGGKVTRTPQEMAERAMLLMAQEREDGER